MYYGEVENIGTDRHKNTFELSTPLNEKALQTKLTAIPNIKIYHNGICTIVETPITVQYNDLLKALLAANIEINYFRDISNSVKQLFE